MDFKNKIYWCNHCKTPISLYEKEEPKVCSICKEELTYLSADIRPVFPEERLLLELIFSKPFAFLEKSVWCSNSTYFVNSEKYTVSNSMWNSIDTNLMRKQLEDMESQNTYKYFNDHVNTFILANKEYFNKIRFEAMNFVLEVSQIYPDIDKYISFSGGKDSTVQADIVKKSIGDASMLHIFCNTTLEYPFTLEYVKRMKQENPNMILKR